MKEPWRHTEDKMRSTYLTEIVEKMGRCSIWRYNNDWIYEISLKTWIYRYGSTMHLKQKINLYLL